jgi:kynureninase
MHKWATRATEGRFTGKFPWFPLEDIVIEESARIVGGKEIEVTVMNTLTVNVHLSMVSLFLCG